MPDRLTITKLKSHLEPAMILDTSRHQHLRAKGWIPPQKYRHLPPGEVVTSKADLSYNAHPASIMPTYMLGGLTSPWYLFGVRILQDTLALIYLVLLFYSAVHPGYWNNLSQPLGFGCRCCPLSSS